MFFISGYRPPVQVSTAFIDAYGEDLGVKSFCIAMAIALPPVPSTLPVLSILSGVLSVFGALT